MIDQGLKVVDDIMGKTDEFFFTEQEKEDRLDARHKIDASSDSWIPKAIRPFIAGVVTIMWAFVVILSLFRPVDPVTIGSVSGVFLSVIGFYFNSRKAEKLQTKRANAAIVIKNREEKIERL